MVGRVTHNWLLKGYRVRNRRKSRRNSTGKYVSVAAEPGELKLRHTPHLAFFDEAYYDRVIAAVDERNAKYRRKGKNGVDTRRRVPKKRTRFPGQSLVTGRRAVDTTSRVIPTGQELRPGRGTDRADIETPEAGPVTRQ